MTLHAKMTMPDLQRTIKSFLWARNLFLSYSDSLIYMVQSVSRLPIPEFVGYHCTLNCLFHLRVLCKIGWNISCLSEAMEKLLELNTLQVSKTTIYSTILIRLRFQGYSFNLPWGSLEITRRVPLRSTCGL